MVTGKCYIGNRFRTSDSVSDSGSYFELKEQLDLPDNIVCYVDGISIPHAWRTLESHSNKFYTISKTEYTYGSETTYNCIPYVFKFSRRQL